MSDTWTPCYMGDICAGVVQGGCGCDGTLLREGIAAVVVVLALTFVIWAFASQAREQEHQRNRDQQYEQCIAQVPAARINNANPVVEACKDQYLR